MEFGFEPVCDQLRAGSSYLDMLMWLCLPIFITYFDRGTGSVDWQSAAITDH